MKNLTMIPCLLACALTLTACGGGAASSWVESSVSEPPAKSVQEPASSVTPPAVITVPDTSSPASLEAVPPLSKRRLTSANRLRRS